MGDSGNVGVVVRALGGPGFLRRARGAQGGVDAGLVAPSGAVPLSGPNDRSGRAVGQTAGHPPIQRSNQPLRVGCAVTGARGAGRSTRGSR
jgi:hypothetical protein